MVSLLFIATACGPPPQTQSQVSVTYRASFRAEPGVTATVTYPWPADGIDLAVIAGLQSSDGGTAQVVSTSEGTGLSVDGHGSVDVTFDVAKLEALSGGTGIPDAKLSRLVPDAGPNDYFFKVNKGGSATLGVDFEYTVSRNCGGGCGGSRSWSYAGPVGLSVQPVTLTFKEQKTP